MSSFLHLARVFIESQFKLCTSKHGALSLSITVVYCAKKLLHLTV
jgi:hypothetical protein